MAGQHKTAPPSAKAERCASVLDVGDASVLQVDVEQYVQEEEGAAPRLRFWRYLLVCTLTSTGMSALAIALWSSMGMGQVAVDWLQATDWMWYPTMATCCIILVLLITLDFFRPPHIPGQYMRLWKTDVIFGRSLFGLAVLCFFAGCLFMATKFPSIPLVMFIILVPVTLGILRIVTAPPTNAGDGAATENLRGKVSLFLQLAALEVDSGYFFTAASMGLLIAAVLSVSVWLFWVLVLGHTPEVLTQRSCIDGWLAPPQCTDQFTYEGRSYDGCVIDGESPPWCSHAPKYMGTWSNCVKCDTSVVEAYVLRTESSCSAIANGCRGSTQTSLEQCQAFCSLETACSFVMHYGPSGCNHTACPCSGDPASRCVLALDCNVSQGLPTAPQGDYAVYQKTREFKVTLSDKDKDEIHITWSAPLVIAISNLVFASYAGARVFFHRTYTSTMCSSYLDLASLEGRKDADTLRESHARMQEKSFHQLSLFVKLTVCMFILSCGLLWVACQLLYADSQVATMIMGLMGTFFLAFVAFTIVALRRVVLHLYVWLARLPIWGTIGNVVRSDWARASILIPALPLVPILLALSALNQWVRRRRGIYAKVHLHAIVPPEPSEDTSGSSGGGVVGGEQLWVTPWVHQVLSTVGNWNWLSIIFKCYIECGIFFAYSVFPLLLNVALSWFNSWLQRSGLGFDLVLVVTFFVGVVAMLLPPVPGLTVYIFGGLVVAGSCPMGFWWGACINIFLGWFLKHFASAIQQVGIGGLLGRSMWVRQTIGVHKVAIRCIEAELRRPGLTLGKVAILCGGPDWPTSVLAGMLNLSLFQCELGTLPIILFVVPCSLSGSFYTKKGTSVVWNRSANLMIVASLTINLLLWALAAWAMQQQLDKNFVELTRPLPQNVDLEWMDYKASQLEQEFRVPWRRVPLIVRGLYALGAFVHIVVGHSLWWGYYYLFNNFEVSSDIETLKSWSGDEGVVTHLGVLVVSLYMITWTLYVQFFVWIWCKTRKPRLRKEKELSLKEDTWKQEWIQNARSWVPPEEHRSFCA